MTLKKLPAVIVLIALLAIAGGCSRSNNGDNDNDNAINEQNGENYAENGVDWELYNEWAKRFIMTMAIGDYDTAAHRFSEEMAAGFGAEGLQEVWSLAVALAGEFIEANGLMITDNSTFGEYLISTVATLHENYGFGWNVVFSEDGIIQGLNTVGIISLSALTAYTLHPPTAAQRNGFTDYNVIIGENTAFPLNGILSMPHNAEGIPGVVIVQGSGPLSMDGAMFNIAPYRDIADALAINGVAVIRHDKRTYAYGAMLEAEFGGSLTVWHESIEDAIFAAEMLRADPRVDENRVFILGHSLGGSIAPRIHAYGGNFAGLILMAASPRCMLDVFIEQNTASINYSFAEGLIDEEAMLAALAELNTMAEMLASVSYMPIDEARTTHLPALGVWTYYFTDMQAHSFADYANIAVPIMVLQGGRDFQVLADVDFVMLQELFDWRDDVTFKLYENLNHSFMQSTAENFVQHAMEIMQMSGNVYAAVLQDITYWIFTQQ